MWFKMTAYILNVYTQFSWLLVYYVLSIGSESLVVLSCQVNRKVVKGILEG